MGNLIIGIINIIIFMIFSKYDDFDWTTRGNLVIGLLNILVGVISL